MDEQINTGASTTQKSTLVKTLVITGIATVTAVISTVLVIKSDADAPPKTTTTTVNPNMDRLRDAVESCDADAFFERGQVVFNLDQYSASRDILAMDCIADELMSPATYAQWGTTTAMSGLQEVTEDGLVFKFSYNGLNDTMFLAVSLAGA